MSSSHLNSAIRRIRPNGMIIVVPSWMKERKRSCVGESDDQSIVSELTERTEIEDEDSNNNSNNNIEGELSVVESKDLGADSCYGESCPEESNKTACHHLSSRQFQKRKPSFADSNTTRGAWQGLLKQRQTVGLSSTRRNSALLRQQAGAPMNRERSQVWNDLVGQWSDLRAK
mmetsp:Transcript_19223/g.24752  ORF Transcript_19223/g.24752 Transcript_19223/m.24752 type:complete len:173 (-) Transcript_19223:168-686(-)